MVITGNILSSAAFLFMGIDAVSGLREKGTEMVHLGENELDYPSYGESKNALLIELFFKKRFHFRN